MRFMASNNDVRQTLLEELQAAIAELLCSESLSEEAKLKIVREARRIIESDFE